MKQSTGFLVRLLAATVMAGLIGGCVSPGAKVPCDGRLEPINLPAKKSESPGNSRDPHTRKESP